MAGSNYKAPAATDSWGLVIFALYQQEHKTMIRSQQKMESEVRSFQEDWDEQEDNRLNDHPVETQEVEDMFYSNERGRNKAEYDRHR